MGKSLVSCFLRHIVFTAVCWYHTCRGGYATSECCRLLTTVHSKVPWVVSSSRSSRWMQKKITPRPFLAGILTLKQCYRVHMNTPFSFRKLKKFPSAPVAPRTTCIRRSTFARPPLQNPRYATVHTTACMMHPVYHKYCNDCGNRSINVCSTCTSNTFLEEWSVWV